jgi:hypothetical protein
MKYMILILTAFWMLTVNAAPAIPALPEDACDSGNCTREMKAILSHFNYTPGTVSREPAVYSGGCYHLGDLNPNHLHYAELMIDQLEDGTTYFSTIFGYFYKENPYADWSLEKGRQESTDNWRKYGRIIDEQETSRAEIYWSTGAPGYAYYMRQDPVTKTIYYITYAGFGMQSSKIFCTMTKNP